MALVLTTNEVVLNPDHVWNDVEGVQYHYPNQYKNKVRTGERFVYYRGVHRKGGRTAPAEYFGTGRIGDIRADPSTAGASRPSWFCEIVDYVPFAPPVPAKPNGVFFEDIPQNFWRNGIRTISEETLARIVAAAGLAAAEPRLPSGTRAAEPSVPAESDSLIVPPRLASSTAGRAAYRRSPRAKEVGDWAERAALRFINAHLNPRNLKHRAAIGEMPGWDIDFVDSDGTLQRVEVKGTTGAAFTSVDLTANELRAAREFREHYWLYLVASCLSDHPEVRRIRSPAALIEAGQWKAVPALYTVRLA